MVFTVLGRISSQKKLPFAFAGPSVVILTLPFAGSKSRSHIIDSPFTQKTAKIREDTVGLVISQFTLVRRTLVAGISFGGLSSGLPPNIVEQLIDAERQPIRNIEVRKTKIETKLTLVNGLEEKLRGIQSTIGDLASRRGFNDIKLQSGDPNIVGGTVDPGASVNGSWNIEVLELAQKSAAITNGFPDKDTTEIGVGYFKFDTKDGSKEVYINGNNNTLEGAAEAINTANVGLRATVINDRRDPDAPFRLMISGDAVGDENKVSYPALYFLDGDQDLYFDESREAKNGRIKVDGFELEVTDNKVKDVVPGVTLDLRQAAPGRMVNISVSEDREKVNSKVKDFVKGLNEVLQFIQSQNRMDGNTDTTKTLGGDSLLRSVESRIRSLVQNPQVGISGSIRRLGDLGVSFNRSGTLDLNEERFNNTLSQRPDDVVNFFAGDGFNVGFIPSLRRELDTLLNGAFGPIPSRQRSMRDRISRMDDQIARKEDQLAKKEQTLRNKFARLEETMSRLKSQGGAMAALGGAAAPNVGIGR
ncbi:MAG: flagellar filament capping protein FliD [Pseudobdellovibrionaceae bacterium]|nr:flagellar filament capping protein FliD [Bdellovibrionales bacterium]USN48993.1 MAG: flagellar filament capping protein FliD [Pseudobdellovibrionaceae bacterium]